MSGHCLKFVVATATCLTAIQAGAQVSLPLPAEIDATAPHFGTANDKAPDEKNARKTAEASVETAYSAAMKRCDDLKGTEKFVCVGRAKAQKTRGMADIDTPLRTAPQGQPSTRSTK
ncbi:hypothetical protein J2W35_006844 [Variovorax boronicumulans]|uniref:hypothetical protein n=1 Tax=Variovorax boronicumulans TaxID=436515 RepID=UPI002785E48B|nr:hypothetical protein [Variovorax boronicumulans]MDQ0086462.1 hypothetical protein [Variovorax boronicumulans]